MMTTKTGKASMFTGNRQEKQFFYPKSVNLFQEKT